MRKKTRKAKSRKIADTGAVWSSGEWRVISRKLKRAPGRPARDKSLFRVVAEKLPYAALDEVQKKLKEWGIGSEGVYLAHDSVGVARYGGRGQIFSRLRSRKKLHPTALFYFSFYIVPKKNHERELETAILRAASTQLWFNQRKVREGIERGNVADYEAGTFFFRTPAQAWQKGEAKAADASEVVIRIFCTYGMA